MQSVSPRSTGPRFLIADDHAMFAETLKHCGSIWSLRIGKTEPSRHLRMAEYEVLVTAADLAGHHGVGLLLEACLADKLAFAERNRRLIV
jgi:hypothetical protein